MFRAEGRRTRDEGRTTKVSKILKILKKTYSEASKIISQRRDPFETIVTTALSAHTTDAIVDKVTPALFIRYPTPARLARAKQRDVERIIRPVGLYRAKAKNIVAAAKMIEKDFGGKVPCRREELVKLPGVGRKTANVVLIKAFGVPAMPVDTHVFRVANRIGLAHAKTPERTEDELVEVIPRKHLGAAHFYFILHGRRICRARKPLCKSCPIVRWCKYFLNR
jgi:endonuclease-3